MAKGSSFKNSHKSKVLTGVAAGCVAAALTIGGTLAFLSAQSNTKINNFTFGSGANGAISAYLTEPKWDGITSYDGEAPVFGKTVDGKNIYGFTAGNINSPVINKTSEDAGVRGKTAADGTALGLNQAVNLLPGETVNKNPLITNSSSQTNVWTALKITFVYGGKSNKAGQPLSAEDMAAVNDVININYDTQKWVENTKSAPGGTSKVLCYKEVLQKGETTSIPAFSTVDVKPSATTEQMNKISAMGNFSIFIEGYATQDTEFSKADDFITANIPFAHTPTAAAPADLTANTSGRQPTA